MNGQRQVGMNRSCSTVLLTMMTSLVTMTLLSGLQGMRVSVRLLNVYQEKDQQVMMVLPAIPTGVNQIPSSGIDIEEDFMVLHDEGDISMHLQNDKLDEIAETREGENLKISEIPTKTLSKNATQYIFSGCLLIKDDNEILNEWIAYHYHVLNLRQLIVAVDPSSTTSPTTHLHRWTLPPFTMAIQEWEDSDYLPESFLQGNYDQVPALVPHTAENSVWHIGMNMSRSEIEKDLQKINNHRFRQATFVSQCFRYYQQEQQNEQYNTSKLSTNNDSLHRPLSKWVIHIDTDEYIVPNLVLRSRPNLVRGVDVPQIPSAGSVSQFINDMYRVWPKRLLPSCLMMPSLFFGSNEENRTRGASPSTHASTLTGSLPPLESFGTSMEKSSFPMHARSRVPEWNLSQFETLRWMYHAGLEDKDRNGLSKAMVDVSTLPDDHPIFTERRIKSVHQPLDSSYSSSSTTISVGNTKHNQICRRYTLTPQIDQVRLYPLLVHHYIGSWERYSSRKDVRRNREIYERKSKIPYRDINDTKDGTDFDQKVLGSVDDGWIQHWWISFLETHGESAVKTVMSNYKL